MHVEKDWGKSELEQSDKLFPEPDEEVVGLGRSSLLDHRGCGFHVLGSLVDKFHAGNSTLRSAGETGVLLHAAHHGLQHCFQGVELVGVNGLSTDMEAACYGSYFLETAAYFAQENLDGTELLKLLYQSLRALLRPALPNRLVRRVFELKSMVINGEYTQDPPVPVSDSCHYAWEYVICSPSESLYQFALKEEVLKEFESVVEKSRRYFVRHEFRSLEILETLTA